MAIKPGETTSAEIQIVKVRRGQPTVVLIDGKRFVLDPGK